MDNQYVISVLNDLIGICKNGEKGFIEASESTMNGFYQMLFMEYARQRKNFASTLQGMVRHLGGNPERKGNMDGILHRGWMNARSAFDPAKVKSIAFECRRGELEALKHYATALEEDFPHEVKQVLQQQYLQIQETEKRIEAMLL